MFLIRTSIIAFLAYSTYAMEDEFFDTIDYEILSENPQKWDCVSCTFGNEGGFNCGACTEDKRNDWSCSKCTVMNGIGLPNCSVCLAAKPSKIVTEEIQQINVNNNIGQQPQMVHVNLLNISPEAQRYIVEMLAQKETLQLLLTNKHFTNFIRRTGQEIIFRIPRYVMGKSIDGHKFQNNKLLAEYGPISDFRGDSSITYYKVHYNTDSEPVWGQKRSIDDNDWDGCEITETDLKEDYLRTISLSNDKTEIRKPGWKLVFHINYN